MKRISILFLLCCLGFAAGAQIVAAPIYPCCGAGSFNTGNATSTVRTDNTIVTTSTTQRGYAVFDLSSIPAGATITSCTIGFYVSSYGGAGVPSGWTTYGFPGHLDTTFVVSRLFADMVAGSILSTATYGTATGSVILASTAGTVGFVQANIGSQVSISWTGGASRIYTIAGESGPLSTVTAGHAPYLQISYCPKPTAVVATASPTTLCSGDVLTLNGSATGATNFNWNGPSGYSSTSIPANITTTTSSAGVYTLTAVNVCGVFSASATATTTSVTVNPLPVAISGSSAVCSGGGTTTLTDASGAGTWSSSATAIANVNSTTGDVTGVIAGTSTIQFKLNSTGCTISRVETVNDAPGPISGPTNVCEAGNITLTEGSTGGAWTSTAGTGSATVGGAGFVTGSTAGNATISYTIPGCAPATYPIAIDPLPAPYGGTMNVCEGYTTTLTELSTGGTWTSSNTGIATVGTGTGVVTGVSNGPVNIIYTLPTGCRLSTPFTVNLVPVAISGPSSVCPNAGVVAALTDATPGGTWSSDNNSIATVITGGGQVSGVTTGIANITYKLVTGCYITTPITVYPLPAVHTGPSTVCQNSTITLDDSDPGGEWTSSNTAIATVGTGSGDVLGTGGGGVTITYTLPTGCYDLAPITVLPAPAHIITPSGPTTFCAGGSVTLTASGGGVTYQWYKDGIAIPGATINTYTATTSNSFTVEISNAAGCVATSLATAVTAGIDAEITAATAAICKGDHAILGVSTGGAIGTVTYQWELNGAAIPAATSGSYYATTAGNYQVVVSISGGSGACIVVSPSYPLTVNPLPTPVIAWNGVTLSTSSAYRYYQWFVNTLGIPGATTNVLHPSANGLYNVKVTDINGCSNFSNSYEFNVVAVPQVAKTEARIFPNPATSVLHIEATAKVRAVVTGMEGQILIDKTDAKDLDIISLPAGLYIVLVYDANGERLMVEKLVKE